jgi:protein-tyrosine phosphatase
MPSSLTWTALAQRGRGSSAVNPRRVHGAPPSVRTGTPHLSWRARSWVLMDRKLEWDGCVNVRDLGGLRTADGCEIRRGALVRADAVDRLTAAGWAALREHGIRTVIDLRNDDEIQPDVAPRPAGLSTLRLPLDGIEDREFWDQWTTGPQFGTPCYYRPFFDRFPQRTAVVISAIARARPGGVLVHCAAGRDRTGLISMLVLALVGVMPEEIAADYALSADCLGPNPEIDAFLVGEGMTASDAMIAVLASLDAEGYLRAAGVGDDELAALRRRLLAAGAPASPA